MAIPRLCFKKGSMYVVYQLGAGIYIFVLYVLGNRKDERNDLVNRIIGSRRHIPTQLVATHLTDQKIAQLYNRSALIVTFF